MPDRLVGTYYMTADVKDNGLYMVEVFFNKFKTKEEAVAALNGKGRNGVVRCDQIIPHKKRKYVTRTTLERLS